MPLSLTESQVVTELAGFLYDFLPGTPHPYADKSISFAGVANSLGLGSYWHGGSKRPAITILLERTLETRRDRFCDLMIGIVRKGISYRNTKGNPVTREDILSLNEMIARIQFKIPELWDPKFLDNLPVRPHSAKEEAITEPTLDMTKLRENFLSLTNLDVQKRGYAFEQFLNELFKAFKLNPRGPFRLVGEQIDGSFELDCEVYLLEAKWQDKQTGQSDILVLQGKVGAKAAWARGLFMSYSGFTEEGLEAFSRGRATNLIGVSGQDLWFILEGKISPLDALKRKVRLAAETGRFYVAIQEIISC